jgi:LacI family transcriptional regulator
MSVTIKEIAKQLHIHNSTVSRALNDRADISVETKEKVRSLAAKLDYLPHDIARNLVLKKTNVIGLIVTNNSSPFYAEIIRGVESVAGERDYTVLFGNTNENYQRELKLLGVLRSKRVDGIIVASLGNRTDHIAEIALKTSTPIVLIDRYLESVEMNYVVSDNYRGAYQAVVHLIKLGHRRIGYITASVPYSSTHDRLIAYQNALKEHGIQLDDRLVRFCGLRKEAGYEGTKQLLSRSNPPTAIFLNNDLLAIGAYQAVKEMGLKVPTDIAFVGFDDLELCSYLSVPLTTIRQKKFEMGTKAAEILIANIESEKPLEPHKIVLPTELVVRESCGVSEPPGPEGEGSKRKLL